MSNKIEELELQTMPLRFRVWDKNEKCFVPIDHDWGFAIRIDGGISHHHGVIDYGWQERFVISQDTGLKDNNGESIYTGDIIKFKGSTPNVYGGDICSIGYIRYEDGGLFVDEGGLNEIYPLYDINGYADSIKVIGNIWQNEEVVEGLV